MQYSIEHLRELYNDAYQERNVLRAALIELGYGNKLDNLKALVDLELATPENIRTILFTP